MLMVTKLYDHENKNKYMKKKTKLKMNPLIHFPKRLPACHIALMQSES